MSNVLIGIIGVILFIGLALAGALFLGPRFQQATANSKAAATVQAISQVARALELYEVQEGRQYVAGTTSTLISAGYMKAPIPNPMNPEWMVDTRGLDGVSGSGPAGVAAVGAYQTGNNVQACAAIARQSGQTLKADGSPPDGGPTLPTQTQGCFVNAGGWAGLETTLLIAYHKVR
jgi:hypothetical protein